jgi:hypothetical protein
MQIGREPIGRRRLFQISFFRPAAKLAASGNRKGKRCYQPTLSSREHC